MRNVKITIEGLTPYVASRYFQSEMHEGETPFEHEKRRWKEKAHVSEDGEMLIPGICFVLALHQAAYDLGMSKTIPKNMCAMCDVKLGVNIEDVTPIEILSIYKMKTNRRRRQLFPCLKIWGGVLKLRIFNDTIPENEVERLFEHAGIYMGVGYARPSTSPVGNGRFRPVRFEWSKAYLGGQQMNETPELSTLSA